MNFNSPKRSEEKSGFWFCYKASYRPPCRVVEKVEVEDEIEWEIKFYEEYFPDFLENDVGLWDAFFMHSKNSSKFQSVLKPSLPVCDYMQDHLRRGGGKTEVRDLKSLQVLLPSAQAQLVTRSSQAGPEEKQVRRLSWAEQLSSSN